MNRPALLSLALLLLKGRDQQGTRNFLHVTAPREAFAPWHRYRPPSLDRRAVTRHPMTPSDRREPGLQISAGIQT
jgi:hypothetical protein